MTEHIKIPDNLSEKGCRGFFFFVALKKNIRSSV